MAAGAGEDTASFVIPSFVCATGPTLAPGGGAEVLPANLPDAWFSNNGFTIDNQYSQINHHSNHYQNNQNYAQSSQSASVPFEFDSACTTSIPAPPNNPTLTRADLSSFVQPPYNASALPPAPSPLGLPVYSASGFDILSILARVASRPHPRIVLGPVDLTCSFVVVDVRRYDHPIVYCSPTFCHLTGYSESEILGRNCRFLQAPDGQVQRGEHRRYTSHDAVVHLKKNLSADKECQTSIVNYKKDGTAFINLVTVVPVHGGLSGAHHEESEVIYHVGFQVDLTQQPNAILEKLRDGSYIIDYTPQPTLLSQPSSLHNTIHSKDRKAQPIPSVRMSKGLKALLNDPAFIKSIPITSSTTIPPSQHSSSSSGARPDCDSGNNQLLHLLLLEVLPDFICVVSLKGSFLYVSPSVRRVLGYESEELVGASISDYAHPEDVVPLMRELKEGSATGLAAVATAATAPSADAGRGVTAASDHSHHHHHSTGIQIPPRTVDLLFRARTKTGVYVWVECKGRLHPEPGKGRKAIVLSGRAKEMPQLDWRLIAHGGGLSLPVPTVTDQGRLKQTETEVWGMMTNSRGGGVVSFLVVGSAVTDFLGWLPSDLIGREVVNFVAEGGQNLVDQVREGGTPNPRRVFCRMHHKDGSLVDTFFVLYRPAHDPLLAQSKGITPAPMIYQLLLANQPYRPASLFHPLNGNVFEELDTSRESSWQYELQQIRFANQRLHDEIAVLEKQLNDADDMQNKVLEHHYSQQDHLAQPLPQPPHHQSLPPGWLINASHPPPPLAISHHDWDPSLFMQSLGHTRIHGLKRSWDVANR